MHETSQRVEHDQIRALGPFHQPIDRERLLHATYDQSFIRVEVLRPNQSKIAIMWELGPMKEALESDASVLTKNIDYLLNLASRLDVTPEREASQQ